VEIGSPLSVGGTCRIIYCAFQLLDEPLEQRIRHWRVRLASPETVGLVCGDAGFR